MFDAALEEKESTIGELRGKMLALSAECKQQVESALSLQQKELLDLQSSRCDQLRVEKHEMETRHQVNFLCYHQKQFIRLDVFI